MKKIRKALVMANGVAVHSLEELNDNWYIESVYKYCLSGELLTWLKERYYLEQFDKLSCIDSSDEEVVKKTLCEVFNQQYVETCNKGVGLLNEVQRLEIDVPEREESVLGERQSAEMTSEEIVTGNVDVVDDNTEGGMNFSSRNNSESQEDAATREGLDKVVVGEKSVLSETQSVETLACEMGELTPDFSGMIFDEDENDYEDEEEDDEDEDGDEDGDEDENDEEDDEDEYDGDDDEDDEMQKEDAKRGTSKYSDDVVGAAIRQRDANEDIVKYLKGKLKGREDNSKIDKCGKIIARLKLLINLGIGVVMSLAVIRTVVRFLFSVEINNNKYFVAVIFLAGVLVLISAVGTILLWVFKGILRFFK